MHQQAIKKHALKAKWVMITIITKWKNYCLLSFILF